MERGHDDVDEVGRGSRFEDWKEKGKGNTNMRRNR